MAKRMVQIGKTELSKMRKKIEAEERKKEKRKERQFDGLGPFMIQKIRNAIRQLWMRSSPARKIVVKRSELKGGYSRCEKCKKKVPKVYIDHKVRVGDLDNRFLNRLFCPSNGLQALCKICHDKKTAIEKKSQKETEKNF